MKKLNSLAGTEKVYLPVTIHKKVGNILVLTVGNGKVEYRVKLTDKGYWLRPIRKGVKGQVRARGGVCHFQFKLNSKYNNRVYGVAFDAEGQELYKLLSKKLSNPDA